MLILAVFQQTSLIKIKFSLNSSGCEIFSAKYFFDKLSSWRDVLPENFRTAK